jgi:hypothetical protein
MSQLKLFSEEQHAQLFQTNLLNNVQQVNRYVFSVIWENGPTLALFQLEGSIGDAATAPKHQIITQRRVDNDGEISIEIGHFPVGRVLNLWWGIMGIDSILRCSVWVTNMNTRQAKKISPAGVDEFKAIDVNADWSDSANGIVLF